MNKRIRTYTNAYEKGGAQYALHLFAILSSACARPTSQEYDTKIKRADISFEVQAA